MFIIHLRMTSAQPQPQPAGSPLFTKSTKFNDLPDHLKKTFEEIEYVLSSSLSS